MSTKEENKMILTFRQSLTERIESDYNITIEIERYENQFENLLP